MTLAFAERCVERLAARLQPFSERMAVVGSIRRRRAEVGDIDLVAIPKVEQEPDLLGTVVTQRNLLAAEVGSWCQAEGWPLTKDGSSYLSWIARGVQVDLWFATPAIWGSLLLCKTGSKEHNVWLCMRALDLGGKWNPHHGLYLDGRVVGEDEALIYRALGLPFLDPILERDEPAFRSVRPIVP
ncbi:MAG: hypothetical protein KF833_18475 [Verrucomicrobiae bacterium]|nr:hypothetical protein [Verrucomicrobiae bacterium]